MWSCYFYCHESKQLNRDSSVDMVTRLRFGLHRNRSCIPWRARRLSTFRPALGPTTSLIQWVLWALSAEVKWPEREVDKSPPPSAEVNNQWSCTSISPYIIRVCCLINHRDSCVFTFMETITSYEFVDSWLFEFDASRIRENWVRYFVSPTHNLHTISDDTIVQRLYMSFINSETPLHLKSDFPKVALCPRLALHIAYLTVRAFQLCCSHVK